MTDLDLIKDWVAYARECITPGGHGDMDMNLIIRAGLSKLSSEIAKTRHGRSFQDAVLQLLEQGRPEEADHLLIPLPLAPNAGARIASVVRTWLGTSNEPLMRTLLLRGLESDPRSAELLSALDDFAKLDNERALEALSIAVPHNIDWVASHLDLVPERIDPDGKVLRSIAVRTTGQNLPTLIEAIAKIGYAERLIGALQAPDALEHQVARLRPFLEAHPAFAGRV
jgi:hypothetical protein